jgi:hypothetical protein
MTWQRAFAGLATAAVFATSTGCLPTLAAESTAPPGRTARLDAVTGFWGIRSYRLDLSQGVAFAVSCTYEGPCEQLVATSDNPAIAEVRAASLQMLQPAGYSRNQQPTAAVVVVGKEPGATTIRLRSRDGGRDIRVTVVASPLSPVTAAVSR